MNNDMLMEVLRDVEFCNINAGRYYRAIAVTNESTGVVVLLEEAQDA